MGGGSAAWNGTSMATPHTTGVAALYLQSNPSASPAAVRGALYTNTTKGIVTSSKTTNNHLLFTNGLYRHHAGAGRRRAGPSRTRSRSAR